MDGLCKKTSSTSAPCEVVRSCAKLCEVVHILKFAQIYLFLLTCASAAAQNSDSTNTNGSNGGGAGGGGTFPINTPFCGSNALHEQLMNSDNDYKKQFNLMNEVIYKASQEEHQNPRLRMPQYTIPVAVHIVAPPGTPVGSGNNLTDAQVEAGLQLLNQSFSNSGAFYAANGVDVGIQFCLARRKPDGSPSNGITRSYSPLVADGVCAPFGTSDGNGDNVKQLENWDCTQYLNIWLVTDLHSAAFGCSLAGFAYFPGAACGLDGIVQESRYWVTTDGTLVTAHEVGHYFSLFHTFHGLETGTGCLNDDCLQDGDRICDTPPDASSSFAPCNTNSCQSDNPDLPDDNSNTMDYSSCSPFHFTAGQQMRMIMALENLRSSLLSSYACQPVYGWDIAIGLDNDCGAICPTLRLQNLGTNVANSISFRYRIAGGALQTFNWTGSLAVNASVSVQLPCSNTAPGSVSLVVNTVRVNGNEDGYAANSDMNTVYNVFPVLTISSVEVKPKHCVVDGMIKVTATGGMAPYTFQLSNGLVQPSGNFNFLYSGTYEVVVTDAKGCKAVRSNLVVGDECNSNIPDDFILGGTPTYSGGGCYVITQNARYQYGTILNKKQISLKNNFEIRFELNLGSKDGNGADGMSFILQRDKSSNQELGYGCSNSDFCDSIKPSIALEFDTWRDDQGPLWDVPVGNFDHMAWMANRDPDHSHSTALTSAQPILFNEFNNAKNAEDGNFHSFRVTWNVADSLLLVFVGCDTTPRLTLRRNLIRSIFEGQDSVYWGFGGSTGGSYNLQQVCIKYVSADTVADVSVCSGQAVQLSAPSFFMSYQWSPATGLSNPTVRQPIFNGAVSTQYALLMSDSCGSIIRDTVKVEVINFDISAAFACDTANKIIISPIPANTTGVVYSIDGSNYTPNNIFRNVPAGTQYVYARKGDCLKSKQVFALKDSLIAQTPVTCIGLGSISATATGGTPPYQYSLNGGTAQPTGTFSQLQAGVYVLKITDAAGCTFSKSVTIFNGASVLSLVIDSSSVSSCSAPGAFLTVHASGGQGPYFYSLDGATASFQNTFLNLSIGCHSIKAFDSFGCSSPTIQHCVNTCSSIKLDSVKYTCVSTAISFCGKLIIGSNSTLSSLVLNVINSTTGAVALSLTTYTYTAATGVYCFNLTAAQVSQLGANNLLVTATATITTPSGGIQVLTAKIPKSATAADINNANCCPAGNSITTVASALCLTGSNYQERVLRMDFQLLGLPSGWNYCGGTPQLTLTGAYFNIIGYNPSVNAFVGFLHINDPSLWINSGFAIQGTVKICKNGLTCQRPITITLNSGNAMMCTMPGLMCANLLVNPPSLNTFAQQLDGTWKYFFYNYLPFQNSATAGGCNLKTYTINVFHRAKVTGVLTFIKTLVVTSTVSNPSDKYISDVFPLTAAQYQNFDGFVMNITTNCGDACNGIVYGSPKPNATRNGSTSGEVSNDWGGSNAIETVSFAPNPTLDVVTASYSSQSEEVSFEVTDFLGNVVKKVIAEGGSQKEQLISLGNLPNGTYVISFKTKNTTIQEKIVVLKN